MTTHHLTLATCYLSLALSLCLGAATTRYVALDGAHIAPFDTWAKAATNIQAAVDVTDPTDTVLVSNGTYSAGGAATPGGTLFNRVMVTQNISVVSLAGPTQTFIEASYYPITRCTFLSNGALLAGFTLEDGNTTTNGDFVLERGGGGALLSDTALLSNCVIRYCTAYGWGGGVFCNSGGTVADCEVYSCSGGNAAGIACVGGGAVLNSFVHENNAGVYVGGIGCYSGGLIDGCTISNNYVTDADIAGVSVAGGGVVRNSLITDHSSVMSEFSRAGGLYVADGGTAEWCLVTANESRQQGGGASVQPYGVIRYCSVRGNRSLEGGGIYCMPFGRVENCLVAGNHGNMGGGLFLAGDAFNCTLVDNNARWRGGGVYCAENGSIANSIVYHNAAPQNPNIHQHGTGTVVSFSCTPSNPTGAGNITNDPMLVGVANPHIASNSPCIDAGSTPLAAGPVDIDAEPRISGAAVDMGCDEVLDSGLTGALSVAIMSGCTDAVAGFSLPFKSAIEGKVTSFQWLLEGNGTIENATVITPAWPSPGDYDVVLTAFNADYPAGVSATVSVHIVGPFTNYVDAASATPVTPYTSWPQAASNLQDAVDVCPCGGVILVATGVYDRGGCKAAGTGNRVALNKPVSMYAVGPAEDTLIVGISPPGNQAMRCAYLGPGAALHGFTLTNGATDRSGDTDGPVNGGGAFLDRNALIADCYVVDCQAWYRGGGIMLGSDCEAINCRVTGCSGGNGGGVFCDSASQLHDSLIYGNQCYDGGGVFLYYGGAANRCVIRENVGLQAGNVPGTGSGVCCINGSSLANSLVYSNISQGAVLGGGVACLSQTVAEDFMVVDNCTIVANTATEGGGVFCNATLSRDMWVTVRNSIIVDNVATDQGANFLNSDGVAEFAYCCSQPLPPGPGAITNHPVFVNPAASDYHQLSSSPGVDAGTNAYAALPWDLDHNPRIWDGTVDMGCYEWIPEPCGGLAALAFAIAAVIRGRSRCQAR